VPDGHIRGRVSEASAVFGLEYRRRVRTPTLFATGSNRKGSPGEQQPPRGFPMPLRFRSVLDRDGPANRRQQRSIVEEISP